MKYGEQLQHDSVPQWSLHNLDYNSLKHEIKVHTTRAQATAIAIPGHQDAALLKFEDELYSELCRQHDRVDLFVNSKADEILRRIAYLANSITKWIGKCPQEQSSGTLFKRQRRFIKHERELLQCGDDIQSLVRFANAQTVAFRKIIKKYKKWTSSTTLGSRFTDNILSNLKSFTRRDYSHLRARFDQVLASLRENIPHMSEPSSPSSDGLSPYETSRPSTANLPDPMMPDVSSRRKQSSQVKYWNEYDDGSDAGGPEDDYAIYVNPQDGSGFPGLGYVQAVLGMPFERAKQWFRLGKNPEREPLLTEGPRQHSYASTANSTDSGEDGYASSSDMPAQGFSAHYAFPSIGDQKVVRYRENVLFWATLSCFIISFLLLAISGVLISTGRHKLRVEVDAAVTVGVMMSVVCACTGLAMTFGRRDSLSWLYQLVVWCVFVAFCLLNGMLLVLVVGNAP